METETESMWKHSGQAGLRDFCVDEEGTTARLCGDGSTATTRWDRSALNKLAEFKNIAFFVEDEGCVSCGGTLLSLAKENAWTKDKAMAKVWKAKKERL